VFVNLNDTKVCCRLAPDVAPQVGESLTLQFDPAKVLLFDAKTGERLGVACAECAHAANVAQQRPLNNVERPARDGVSDDTG
jgi:multiple sugar transport system ATP-binding protein